MAFQKYAAVYESAQRDIKPEPEEDEILSPVSRGRRSSSLSDDSQNSYPKQQSRALFSNRRSEKVVSKNHTEGALPQPEITLKNFRKSRYEILHKSSTSTYYHGATQVPQSSPAAPQPNRRPRYSLRAILTTLLLTPPPYLFCFLRTLIALLQTTLLVYLQISYLSLPRAAVPGNPLPQLNPSYSAYPFISCIGALHLTLYRTLTAIIITLSLTTDTALFLRARTDPIGSLLRRLNLAATYLSATLALLLTYVAESAETSSIHLTVLGAHSLAILCIKITSLAKDHVVRLAHPELRSDRTARRLRAWKEGTVCVATPMAVLVILGTYTCRGESEAETRAKQSPGTACYRVLAIAAPADWVAALVAVNWSVYWAWESVANLRGGGRKGGEAREGLLHRRREGEEAEEEEDQYEAYDRILEIEDRRPRGRVWDAEEGDEEDEDEEHGAEEIDLGVMSPALGKEVAWTR